jgi:hypothetical protein
MLSSGIPMKWTASLAITASESACGSAFPTLRDLTASVCRVITTSRPAGAVSTYVGTIERETVAQVPRDSRWNRTAAAERLGLPHSARSRTAEVWVSEAVRGGIFRIQDRSSRISLRRYRFGG